MGKAKKAANQKANSLKETVKSIKEGQVKKNKAQKFKKTPSGKVALINGNGKANGNSKLQKQTKPVPQQTPSPQKNQKKNKNKNKSPKASSPQKQAQKKKPVTSPAMKDSDEESDEDINEGISIPEDVSNLEDDSDASSDEEVETPNILGASLANTSDEDDEDFEASDDSDEEEEQVNKGVKKFKGSKEMETNESSENEEDSDADEDEDEEEMEDSDEENLDKSVTSSINSTMDTSGATEDSDSDEDDEEDDDDDDDSEEEDGPGLKALLGESLVDQEDDEDFEAESDEEASEAMSEDASEEEENTEESQEEKNMSTDSARFIPTEENPRLSEEEKAEQDTRTIYIGNVPKDLEEKVLKETFKKFGPIQSFRVRGCIPEDPKMKLKVAHIKKKYHPLSKTLCVFLVYKSKDSVDKALGFNGEKLCGNYIRVDRIGKERQADPKKSVFLGNVPFDVEDNELWDMFSKCGKVDYVRTIRDRNTGCCRGIGYINFVEADGATLALSLDGTTLRKRQIRVNRYDPSKQIKSNDKSGQKRPLSGKIDKGTPKKQKADVEQATHNSINAQKRKNKKNKASPTSQTSSPGFQGARADGGKKKGFKKGGNKLDKKKKSIAAKLLAPKKFKKSQ